MKIIPDMFERKLTLDRVEIVFVSSDQSQKAILNYMKESHGDWWAVEHGSSTAEALSTHYKIRSIPTLIVLDGMAS